MRLLHLHSRSILFTNLLILLFGGVLFFYLFNYSLDRNIYNTLQDRKEFARKQLAQSDSLYLYQNMSAHVFSIKRLPEPVLVPDQISDTIIFDPVRKRRVLFRQLTFSDTFRNQVFLVTIRRPYLGDVEVMRSILLSLTILSAILVIAFYFSNRLIARNLWRPFYATLKELRSYQLDERVKIHFPETKVSEFRELNHSLHLLIERIESHYKDLKEYTENTTHEIQTPLAIIQSKLELLQDSPLSHDQLLLLNAAKQAVNRLAKLKEALLLLSRIQNKQFSHVEPVCLTQLLEARLMYFEELILLKEIQFSKDTRQQVYTTINPVLAEVLLDNLISNAIKYTQPGGVINVKLTSQLFLISNSGIAPSIPPASFFSRFTKADPQSKSLGLGLAIVKAICDNYHMCAEYTFADGLHQVSVSVAATEYPQNTSVYTDKSILH